jgi:hypothetical protein
MESSTQSLIFTSLLLAVLLFGAMNCFSKAVRVRSGSYSPFRHTDGTAIRGFAHIQPKLSLSYGLQGAALLLASALFLGTRNALFAGAALAIIYTVAAVVRRYVAGPLLRAR